MDTSAAAEVRVLTAVTGCGDSVPLGESSDADWWPGVYCTPLYSTVHHCTLYTATCPGSPGAAKLPPVVSPPHQPGARPRLHWRPTHRAHSPLRRSGHQ